MNKETKVYFKVLLLIFPDWLHVSYIWERLKYIDIFTINELVMKIIIDLSNMKKEE